MKTFSNGWKSLALRLSHQCPLLIFSRRMPQSSRRRPCLGTGKAIGSASVLKSHSVQNKPFLAKRANGCLQQLRHLKSRENARAHNQQMCQILTLISMLNPWMAAAIGSRNHAKADWPTNISILRQNNQDKTRKGVYLHRIHTYHAERP